MSELSERQNIINKVYKKGNNDSYRVISVRLKKEMVESLDKIATANNRSRNKLISLLLKNALKQDDRQ